MFEEMKPFVMNEGIETVFKPYDDGGTWNVRNIMCVPLVIDMAVAEESIQRRYIDRYQWFLLPALLALLAGALLSRGRLAKKVMATQSAPSTAVRVWPLIFPLALVAGLVQAQVPQPAGLGSTGIIQQVTAHGANQAPIVAPATNMSPANMPPVILGRDGARLEGSGARRQRS